MNAALRLVGRDETIGFEHVATMPPSRKAEIGVETFRAVARRMLTADVGVTEAAEWVAAETNTHPEVVWTMFDIGRAEVGRFLPSELAEFVDR